MSLLPKLVDAATLAAHLEDARLRVIDASVAYLPEHPDPREVYDREHIPGAAFADLPGAFSDPDSEHSFTVPAPERFAEAIGALGVGPGTHVVIYTQTWPIYGTRLWWLLHLHGFDDVSILDGGLGAWRAAGLPLTDAPPAYPPATFVGRRRPELLAPLEEVEAIAAADGAGTCLVNALPEAIFRGEQPATDGRYGRIPGSVSGPWTNLADLETGVFRPLDEQRAYLESIGALGSGRPVVAYCGGGVSATLVLFSLWLLGVDDARLYDGSLSEWLSDASRPVAVG
ncbi:MAG: sulfurtransferase [Solirubrobacteraceae bacterium]|nr:sulfurtransferase [Solirubrobacteraceae bacterium]